MKVTKINNKIIIYINQPINLDLNDNLSLEKYLKKLIITLKKRYSLNFSGLYTARIYSNVNYGLIIELENKDTLDFFPDLIDLKIIIEEDSEFLIEVDDYYLINNYPQIYTYKNKFYTNFKYLNSDDIIKLSEFMNIIYGIKKDLILNKSKIL